ncbi:MAG: hypothetical protein HUU49_01690 [Candidatus Buchananbacteria bacterium]|nr:hypothetical protein [Candidatus Buchananbacteria bacterium]
MKLIFKEWFKILISICIIIATVAVVQYFFFFLPEERDYNRREAKRYECKQDIQGLYSQYNASANGLEQTDENKQLLFSLALNLGLIDENGTPIEQDQLIEKCLRGEL